MMETIFVYDREVGVADILNILALMEGGKAKLALEEEKMFFASSGEATKDMCPKLVVRYGEARGAMLSVTISTKVITWLCNKLDCEALWAEEFAQNFISFLQASGSISIAQEKETSEKEMLESLVFWMEDLLKVAREVQADLMRFYVPEKGYPPHIQALIAPTDYDTVLADAKQMLQVAKETAPALDASSGGYQPTHGDLDPSNPPRGGSGVPSRIPAAAPQKPDWWPRCPYPASIFPMARERYPEIVPDPQLRTALSGMLGREFWEMAQETIWEAMLEAVKDGCLTIISDGGCMGSEYCIEYDRKGPDACDGCLIAPPPKEAQL